MGHYTSIYNKPQTAVAISILFWWLKVRQVFKGRNFCFLGFWKWTNRISVNSFRRNCSFLSLWIVENFNFLLNKMNFCCGNYSKPETMYTGKYGILKNLYSAHKASDLYKMIYLWNHLNVRIFTLPSIANYVCILNISTKFLLWKALGTGATIHGFASLAFSTTFWLISVISHLSPKDRFEKMGYKWSCGSTRSLQNR